MVDRVARHVPAAEVNATGLELHEDFAHYPANKSSTGEWLGDVPDHWQVLPNPAAFTEVSD